MTQAGTYSGITAEADRVRDFKQLFETPQGQRVLNQVLEWCHIMQTSMHKEAMVMAFQEGERNIGLRIMATLNNQLPQGSVVSTEQNRRS